ncbi:MAG: hypothetical protein JHC95_00255 [Solirubrobacteraceae bacterium]|nr:hypothetical protein [Solirubrobacteraceae bacterium]
MTQLTGARRVAAACAMTVVVMISGGSTASAATWHVQAGAAAGGDGSAAAPLSSLAAVEARSAPGDTIVVAPVPRGVLDGGIVLKAGQTLVGGGPSVVGDVAPAALPVITNRAGDGVRLADDTTVSNLVIRRPRRGGIYGLDSVGVQVLGNDVSGHNTSCARGFKVQPFMIPTGIPYVGLGRPIAPQNGWAGIMVDGERAAGSIVISGNRVHDATCGDGIDIRATGTSDLTARVDDNHVAHLKQGWMFTSVLAIGMQARHTARLRVDQSGNRQEWIGSDLADCEGQFINTSQSGVVIETVTRNTFRRGIGGFSCNGFEAVISNGSGTIDLTLTDSTFEDNVGDMFEAANLGSGSTMTWSMERVVARKTRMRLPNSPLTSDPGVNPIPFNVGDCMLVGQNGGSNATTFRMRDSVLEGCNNGISVLSGFAFGNGVGAPRSLVLDIADSRIAGHAKYGIQIGNSTPLGVLDLRMSGTEVTGNRGFGVAVDQLVTGRTGSAWLDLRGNCLHGNRKADLEVTGFAVDAGGGWWGGGAPRVVTRRGGRADVGGALTARPACGPGSS